MWVLQRSRRENNSRLGDVIEIRQILTAAEVAPRFGKKAIPHLTSGNALALSKTFYLNHYCDKEVFYMLL
jgi:hypothetical protein